MQSLSSVDVHVYLKGYFLSKRLLTLITCERFLSSVYPRVSLEIVQVKLLLPLLFSKETLSVCEQVFFSSVLTYFSSVRSEMKAKTLQYKSEKCEVKADNSYTNL